MKVLIISQEIGNTAPGIVFERVLSELVKYPELDIDIVACEYKPSIELKKINVQLINYPSLHYRLNNLIISLFRRELVSEFLKYKINLRRNNYDVIFSFCSSGHLFGLVSGIFLSKKIKCKLGCYLVDAVPAPLGWSKNNRLYQSTCKMVENMLQKVDLIASVNPEMLHYQMSLFEHKPNLLSYVYYPPSLYTTVEEIPNERDGIFRFLYTGNIYGLRTPKYIIEAFSLLYQDIHNVELLFVGNNGGTICNEKAKYDKEVQERIIIKPRVKDLNPYYKKSIALIDIDADNDNDVFLSSKMSSYIACNRPIICETGINSPSRNLFKDIASVIQCNHNPQELKDAMLFVINNYENFDYNDRLAVLKMHSSQNVSKKVYESLLSLTRIPSV